MRARLDHLWRLLATGLCFAAFGIGGMFLGLTLFPLLTILPGSEPARRRRVQRVISGAFRLFLRTVEWLGVGSVSVRNRHLLADRRGVLVLANHPTLLDVVVLVSLLPEADCVVKQALWRNPFLRSVVRGADYVSNSSPQAMLDECRRRLREGRSLVLFPEGTRSVPGRPLEFQRGAARLLLQEPVPVVPVTLTCEPSTLTKNLPWYRIPPRRWHIRVTVHPPIEVAQPFRGHDLPEPVAVRRLTDTLREIFERKLDEHEYAYQ